MGELQKRVDARRPAARLEARDRGLRRPADLGQLRLRKPELAPALGDLLGDLGEEPAVLGAGKAHPQPLDGLLDHVTPLVLRQLRHLARLLYSTPAIEVKDAGESSASDMSSPAPSTTKTRTLFSPGR